MAESKLIELSYSDPGKEVRLTVYADTIIMDRKGGNGTITALRFGGYPEVVRAMSDAIYGKYYLGLSTNRTTASTGQCAKWIPAAAIPFGNAHAFLRIACVYKQKKL